MDTEGLILMSLLAICLIVSFVVFGVTVVRRTDPSPHAVMLGSHLVGHAGMLLVVWYRGFPPSWEIYVGVTLVLTTLQLICSALGWALAVAVRPGEEATSTGQAWVHTVIVGLGTVLTGAWSSDPLFVMWWIPGVMHIVLAYRDSPRLRRAWGTIASIATVTTLAWLVAAMLEGDFRHEIAWVGPFLLAHHGLAAAQTGTARPDVAIWPLVGLVAFRVTADFGW